MEKDHVEIAKYLGELGANVDLSKNFGWKPIHMGIFSFIPTFCLSLFLYYMLFYSFIFLFYCSGLQRKLRLYVVVSFERSKIERTCTRHKSEGLFFIFLYFIIFSSFNLFFFKILILLGVYATPHFSIK